MITVFAFCKVEGSYHQAFWISGVPAFGGSITGILRNGLRDNPLRVFELGLRVGGSEGYGG